MINYSKFTPWEQVLYKDRIRINALSKLTEAQKKLKAEGLYPIPKNEVILSINIPQLLCFVGAGLGAFYFTTGVTHVCQQFLANRAIAQKQKRVQQK